MEITFSMKVVLLDGRQSIDHSTDEQARFFVYTCLPVGRPAVRISHQLEVHNANVRALGQPGNFGLWSYRLDTSSLVHPEEWQQFMLIITRRQSPKKNFVRRLTVPSVSLFSHVSLLFCLINQVISQKSHWRTPLSFK